MPTLKRHKTKYPGVFWIDGFRKRNFYVRYKRDGKLIEEKVNVRTAAQANQVRSQRLAGELSNKERRMEIHNANAWTVFGLCKQYLASRPETRSLQDDHGRYKNYLHAVFGSKEPKEITRKEVEKLKRTLSKTLKPQTVAHILEFLQRIVNYGLKVGLREGIPFKIEMPRFDNKQTEYLSQDQIKDLVETARTDHNPQARGIILTALYTGLRRGAIFRLRWDDLDFERGVIFLRNPKGGKDGEVDVIPMNTAVRDIFNNHPRTDSPYVFPGRNGNQRTEVRKSWLRIKKKAKLPIDFRFHGLRHTFGTLAAASGVDPFALKNLLTHRKLSTTERYTHLVQHKIAQASELVIDAFNDSSTK